MVLIQGGLERSSTNTRAGGLFASTRPDSGATHQISILVGTSGFPLLRDPPENHSNGTEKDGTTNTHNNTDDDLLLGGRETGARIFGFGAQTWRACRVSTRSALGVGGSGSESRSLGSSADSVNGGNNLHRGGCVLGRGVCGGSGRGRSGCG